MLFHNFTTDIDPALYFTVDLTDFYFINFPTTREYDISRR